ncbi:MAG: hypothetical protein LBG59_01120 [Candidatus Peribacteria bacterium]|nr:hypothetical protein [Candidatus Peribacteria bacterium]
MKENAENAFIGGGLENKISAPFSAIGAGVRNIVDAVYSIIPGGIDNTIGADAEYSFAAGQMTNIQHSGTFAWSDDDKQLVIL